MSTDAAPNPLTKVDSAVQGLSSSPPKDSAKQRRASSSVAGVYNINDLGMSTASAHRLSSPGGLRLNFVGAMADKYYDTEKEGTELQIAKETQKLNW